MAIFVLEKPVVPVRAASSLSFVRISKGGMEPPYCLVPPLFGEAARAHDQAPLEVPARDQLFDQEPGHDGLAGAGAIRQQESQWRRGSIEVYGRDQVRQRSTSEV